MSIDARIVRRLPRVRDTPAFELNAHLQASPGITVLFGPSGSGKTLTLNCISGFVRPDEGRILVNDQLYFDAATKVHVPPQRRRCGYIFQEHALFPHMTIRDNLRFAAALPSSRTSRLPLHRRITELLDTFELTDLSDRMPAQLSGGQKQRAAIARVLVTEPRVLLLDEPASGLDARLRKNFHQLLRSVRERLQIPVLLVSHNLEDSFEVADALVLLDQGRVLQMGDHSSVIARPANVEVASMLDIYNIAPAQIQSLDPGANKSRILLFGQEIEGPYLPGHLIGDQGFVCLRRSEMKIAAPGEQRPSNLLKCRVERCSPSATGVRLELEHGFYIAVRETDYQGNGEKELLTFQIPPSAVTFTSK